MNYTNTAEDLLNQVETLAIMINAFGDNLDNIQNWITDLHAKTENYKENMYYHVITLKYDNEDSIWNSGVGEGLYLGKDHLPLIKFYGLDYIDNDEEVPLQVYYGEPNFLDLTNYDYFKTFEESSKEKYPDEINNNELKLKTLELGYDGIRYYDPIATGEEFVLYNTDKVKLIETLSLKITKED